MMSFDVQESGSRRDLHVTHHTVDRCVVSVLRIDSATRHDPAYSNPTGSGSDKVPHLLVRNNF